MEQQVYRQEGSFFQNINDSFQDPFVQNQKYPYIPVQARLKQNKERRLLLQKQKQKENQHILQKRKQKQENVQKVLKQRHEARENAKLIFSNMQKTFNNKFQEPFTKNDEIQQKINQCRSRADQYKTMYKKKIHDNRESRQRSVRQRKRKKDNKQNDRSINYHLAQWRSYEKRIAEKYKNQTNPNRLYEGFIKKQKQLKQLIQKERQQSGIERQSVQTENTKGFKRILIKKVNKKQKVISEQSNIIQKNNPIYSIIDISTFGLSKSIKNPERDLKHMIQFVEINMMLQQVTKDLQLLRKFEEYLQKQIKE